MTLALSNHLGLQSGLQFFESHRLESVWNAAVRHHGRIWEAFQIQLYREHFVSKEMSWPTSTLQLSVKVDVSGKKIQKYTGDMIPITVYTSLKSPCRDICYPFISSVTCKLLQVLLKFFHLLPDRLHLASEISTARINGLFLTRWRAVLGQRTEELCFPAQRWMEIAKKYFWKYTKSAPLNKFVKSENKSTIGHLPLRQSSHCEQPTW